MSLKDLGEHRFKDFATPKRIFQLVIPGLPADFPPLKSQMAFPNNLPIQLTSFIGREWAMAEIKRLMTAARLITFTGAGGSGKTPLALQVAGDVLGEFGDGVWLVDLAPLTDPTLVPQAVASTPNLSEQPGRALTATLADYLQARQVLVILDKLRASVLSATGTQVRLRVLPERVGSRSAPTRQP